MTDIDREGPVSVTQQIADRFAAAIESGELAPGDKLPPTRALATEAGVNHLTAARVYKKLAEEGYVTAAVGRGTFVRSLTPSAEVEHGDDWQRLALPDRVAVLLRGGAGRRVRLRRRPPGHLAGHRLARARASTPPRSCTQITRDVVDEEGVEAFTYLTAPGPGRPARAAGRARAQGGLRLRARGDHRHLRAPSRRST